MTLDNRALLDELLRDGCIRMAQGAVLKEQPRTLAEDFSFDRIEGMLLGLAIGDALGATSESMLPAERRRRHGEVRDYLPHHRVEGQRIGLPTDDTQMAFWTLECLLADDGLVPENLATRFTQERIYGIGRTVREFLRRYKDQGVPWTEAGVHSAGNGALMRIAPVLVPHLRTPSPALWADAACLAQLQSEFGLTLADGLFVSYLLPSFDGWNKDEDRTVVCVLVFPDRGAVVGSYVAGDARVVSATTTTEAAA